MPCPDAPHGAALPGLKGASGAISTLLSWVELGWCVKVHGQVRLYTSVEACIRI